MYAKAKFCMVRNLLVDYPSMYLLHSSMQHKRELQGAKANLVWHIAIISSVVRIRSGNVHVCKIFKIILSK